MPLRGWDQRIQLERSVRSYEDALQKILDRISRYSFPHLLLLALGTVLALSYTPFPR